MHYYQDTQTQCCGRITSSSSSEVLHSTWKHSRTCLKKLLMAMTQHQHLNRTEQSSTWYHGLELLNWHFQNWYFSAEKKSSFHKSVLYMLDPGAGFRSSSKKFLEEFSCSFVDIYSALQRRSWLTTRETDYTLKAHKGKVKGIFCFLNVFSYIDHKPYCNHAQGMFFIWKYRLNTNRYPSSSKILLNKDCLICKFHYTTLLPVIKNTYMHKIHIPMYLGLFLGIPLSN